MKVDNLPHTPRAKTLKNGNRRGNPSNAPRCEAKTRKQSTCASPAMKNGRCRMHGGASTGPKTERGRIRAKRGNWIHGNYSAEKKEERHQLQEFLKQTKKLLEML